MNSEIAETGGTKIARNLTVANWNAAKQQLGEDFDEAKWQRAFDDFFLGRIQSRYLEPITAIQEIAKSDGEGFAVVTIQCALIEFLAAIRDGKKYKFGATAQEQQQHFYSNSLKLFVDFLKDADEFSAVFATGNTADEFYKSVRCGLLHETRTKNGWKIKRKYRGDEQLRKAVIGKVVYRDDLADLIDRYLDKYQTKLLNKEAGIGLREAFIRKFDHLASNE